MTTPAEAHTLDVPGARLSYEIRGSGPLLLPVGAPAGIAGFAPIAEALAEHYTVVTHDPRGIGRSERSDTDREPEPGLLADDLRRLIAVLDSGPVTVFGCSGGAVTGLALTARHPELVRVLVAHEAPLIGLLPDADSLDSGVTEVEKLAREGDPDTAIRRFSVLAGMASEEAVAALPPSSAAEQAKNTYFLGQMAGPTMRYRPDFAALSAAPTRIVAAAGRESGGQLAHRAAHALAERLESRSATTFPGDHVGCMIHPVEFATTLRTVLDAG